MCNFCTKHGDGRKWYLEASNYAYDLTSDLRRRGMMVEFVQGFDERARESLGNMERLKGLPGPARSLAAKTVSRVMQRYHFGQPLPIEDCERIFALTTSIVRVPCVCRHFSGAEDQGYCLAITTQPHEDVLHEVFAGYEHGPDTSAFERLTDAEALALLRRCEEEGMMHSVWTFVTPFIAGMCNCSLAAGCMAMRSTLEYDVKCMWKGEWVVQVDADQCVGCGQCVDLCPFGAIELDSRDEKAVVRLGACYGCGTCRAACGTGALSLAERRAVPAVAGDW